MASTAVLAGPSTWSLEASLVSALLAMSIMGIGSVSIHRLLIHRSFVCPKWIERTLVYIGIMGGLGSPSGLLYIHEIRDWCQRQKTCHPFFSHQSGLLRDGIWYLMSTCHLRSAPQFVPEPEFANDRFYRWLDRYWMLTQVPLAGVLFLFGGFPFVVWGICVRVTLCNLGHWFVGHLAHNWGELTFPIEGNGVQGYNVPGLALLTMGESWHNNHHRFPDSARLGLTAAQLDPGWWIVCLLRWLGLARNVQLPEDTQQRPEGGIDPLSVCMKPPVS
jgi:stearoyl-CoA desaturase (delta-9 desaturase)